MEGCRCTFRCQKKYKNGGKGKNKDKDKAREGVRHGGDAGGALVVPPDMRWELLW